MIRFAGILKRHLRRSIKAGELTPAQSEAASKIIRRDRQSRQAFRQFLAECAGLKGYATACSQAADGETERPILDWIKSNWDKILSLVVSIVVAFLV